jgi:HD superfamily phosphohydrolase
MHIVDKALQKIIINSKIYWSTIDISEYDIKVARLAALLHDVGHYPFSHALKGVIPNKQEEYSIFLIKNRFVDYIERNKIKTKDVIQLIKGKALLKKPFLNSLIGSQLDVDKFDYLLRDSYFAGVKYGIFDLDRLRDSLFVVDNNLVVLDKGYYAAEQLIIARYHMFEQLYYHHTKRSFEGMAKIAAIQMIEESKFKYPAPQDLGTKSKLSVFEHIDDKWFLSRIGDTSNRVSKRIALQIEKRISYISNAILTYSRINNGFQFWKRACPLLISSNQGYVVIEPLTGVLRAYVVISQIQFYLYNCTKSNQSRGDLVQFYLYRDRIYFHGQS